MPPERAGLPACCFTVRTVHYDERYSLMGRSSHLAWRYLIFHWRKSLILTCAVTLILYLPGAMQILVDQAAVKVRRRAAVTPLIVGAKGSSLQLVLNSLYFSPTPPETVPFGEVDAIYSTELATPIPLSARHFARGKRIVGTSLEYFSFRGLTVREGRLPSILGECVVGSRVARELNLKAGSQVVSTPENPFDLAGCIRSNECGGSSVSDGHG